MEIQSGKIDPRLGRSGQIIYKMPVEAQAELLKKIWEKKMGTELDLEHPHTFNEKIQWYKLFYHHPDMPRCVDKVTFKDYVKEILGGGYTANLLRVWNSPDEVSFNGLPERFVVKSNCQDNGRYIAVVRNRKQYNLADLKKEIQDYWFNPQNLLINGFCSAYHTLNPKVFVEEYIETLKETPDECKFFCFNGEPKFCYMTQEHFKQEQNVSGYPMGFYTLDWKLMNVKYGNYQIYKDAPCPQYFSKMIDITRVLSQKFPFVRVDFFITDTKIYLAEMTFYPGGGMVKYDPPEFAKYMGELLTIC